MLYDSDTRMNQEGNFSPLVMADNPIVPDDLGNKLLKYEDSKHL